MTSQQTYQLRVLPLGDNRALSHKLGVPPGLTAEWTFDEGAGQSSADSSGNGLNAILGSSTDVEASDPTWITSTAPH